MKMLALAVVAILLALGWGFDHFRLASTQDSLQRQLADQTHQAHLASFHADLWQTSCLEAKNQLHGLQDKERAQESELQMMKWGSDQQIQSLTQKNQGSKDSFKDAKQALDVANQIIDKVTADRNKWFNIACENRRDLNELWAYTRSLYANDSAVEQAMGEQLYEEMNKPPPSYTAVWNGAGYAITPDQ